MAMLLLSIYGNCQEETHELQLEFQAAAENNNGWADAGPLFTDKKYNINTITEDELQSLGLLNPLQIKEFIHYRNQFGDLISLMELQAVHLWDITTIRKILPFFFVNLEKPLAPEIQQRLREGKHRLLFRTGSNTDQQGPFWIRTHQLLSYRFHFNNLLALGITAEKDAGEKRFPDHLSGYASLRNKGMIKNLLLGDFTVNMGQGLLHWQGYALGQSSNIISGFRQTPLFKPHTGTDENRFHRGIGISLDKKRWEFSAFASLKRIDANISTDSSGKQLWITSIPVSGLHRTDSEIKGRKSFQWFSTGGRIKYFSGKGSITLNFLSHFLEYPIQKKLEPYNAYSMQGKKFPMASIDHSMFTRLGFFYGEFAIQRNQSIAMLQGWMKSLDTKLDISVSGRWISKKYSTFQSNSLTSSGEAEGESGMAIILNYHPHPRHQLELFADRFRKNGITYGSDGIQNGITHGLLYKWIPNKKTEYYVRWGHSAKNQNFSDTEAKTNALPLGITDHWRSHFSSSLHPSWTIRIRNEWCRTGNFFQPVETGFLHYAEAIYKPLLSAFSFSFRGTFFETGSYGSRIYAYERDLYGYYSVPAHSGTGSRFYLLMQYKWKNMTISAKIIKIQNSIEKEWQWRAQILWDL